MVLHPHWELADHLAQQPERLLEFIQWSDSNVTIGSTTGLDTILNAGTDLRAEFGDGTGLFAVTGVLSGNRISLGTTIGSGIAAGTAVTFTTIVSTAGSITAVDYAEGVTGQSFPSTATIYSHSSTGAAVLPHLALLMQLTGTINKHLV